MPTQAVVQAQQEYREAQQAVLAEAAEAAKRVAASDATARLAAAQRALSDALRQEEAHPHG